ncbi:ubiquinol-cytochrome C chaperone family protein [Brevundimonas sp. PAMC22021]|uniref:ubiquinol-cytochrome C chaperone family protein n=1 Tax=Brevundimonas sp. PAMC22021 TaxID=2861285 RepID=UPI001C631E3C|nr:ubiquinol-cytochrome C chaperone family protein [Brevundimonas sp. PAMC22021]QYF87977.1 ubiquinol-cytochrome C chaperone [Brevundimonas sp. PAMC22021]
MLTRLLRPKVKDRTGEALYALAVAQARQPGFYTALGVADRIDSRFELYTLHVLLLVLRLRDEGSGEGEEAAQALFDAYVSALDHALRELGVGDVSVGKKMRKLGEALYGRMKAYEAPLHAGDAQVLAAALARNVYETDNADAARSLAQYALETRAGLATQGLKAIKSGPTWPDIHP